MFALQEFIDVIFMSIGVGYIFMDIFTRPKPEFDPLSYSRWDDLRFAVSVTAPAVIAHELAHKLVALSYGLQATFHAAYGWLGFGVLLKYLGTGFIFFVPGYVSISGIASNLQLALVAFAGPFLNLLLYLLAILVLKSEKRPRRIYYWVLTRKINGFLFIFNMLPIFGFDGLKVYTGLFNHFF